MTGSTTSGTPVILSRGKEFLRESKRAYHRVKNRNERRDMRETINQEGFGKSGTTTIEISTLTYTVVRVLEHKTKGK